MTVKRTTIPAASFAPPLAAATYFWTTSTQGATTSSTLGNGSLRLVPWVVERTVSIVRLGAEISSAGEAGSKLRIAVYADSGSRYPGALVLDAGQINGDSATAQEITIALTLVPGLYWVGGAVQSAATTQPTVRTVATSWSPLSVIPLGTSIPAGTGAGAIGYTLSGVTAAAISTYTAGAAATTNCPRVFARTA